MAIPYVVDTTDGNEKTYEIFSKLLMDRIIFIGDTFSPEMANGVVAQLLYLQSVDSKKDIYMYINSQGGHIDAMYAIYDTMCYVSPDIITIGLGTVASAASFILAAGTKGKRTALANTDIMIHELSAGAQGKAGDIFNRVETLKALHDKMAKHYSKFTGQKVVKLKKDMQRDFHMSAKESLTYGLIDKVIG